MVKSFPIFLTAMISFSGFMHDIDAQQTDKSDGLFTIIAEKGPLHNLYGFCYSSPTAFEVSKHQNIGSGFLIQHQQKNYLITCAHVVDHIPIFLGQIIARDYLKTEYIVKLLGADSYFDIAVLEFISPLRRQYSTFQFSEHLPDTGESISTYGNSGKSNSPLSFKGEVIVRSIKNLEQQIGGFGLVYTSAEMRAGMSGGPALNDKNEVIGICSKKKHISNTVTHFYFLNGMIAQRLISQIIESHDHRPNRPYLGLMFEQETKNYRKSKVVLRHVLRSGPNKTLKHFERSTVLGINNVDIHQLEDVTSALMSTNPGDKIEFKLEHKQHIHHVYVHTLRLETGHLKQIGQHYFKHNPNYSLLVDHGYKIHKNNCKKRPFKHLHCNEQFAFNVITIGQYEQLRCTIRNWTDLGIAISLATEFGGFWINQFGDKASDLRFIDNIILNNSLSSKLQQLYK